MAFDKDYLFKQARFESVSMAELGRRGAAKRKANAQKRLAKTYDHCLKCGGIMSGNRCLDCGF